MSDEMKAQTRGFNRKVLLGAVAVIAVGLIVALVLFIPTVTSAKKVEKQLRLGAKYLSELEYDQAIATYEAVLKIDPKCEEAYLALADVYIAIGDFDKAEEILKRAEEEIGTDVTDTVAKKRKAIEETVVEQMKVEIMPTSSPTINTVQTQNDASNSDSADLLSPESTLVPTSALEPTPTASATEIALEELAKANVGDYVTFGSYEQDNVLENGVEPIEWLVLDKQADKALILSKYALALKAYNEEAVETTWKNCTLRSWLNDEFYHDVFNVEEQAAVIESFVDNSDNSVYDDNGENDTWDRVFLLSVDEVMSYFGANLEEKELSRCAEVTAYALNEGAYCYNHEGIYYGLWRLRTSSFGGRATAGISDEGIIFYGGDVEYRNYVIRPAIWVGMKEY